MTGSLRLGMTFDPDARAVLHVRGEVDSAAAPRLREALLDAVRRQPAVVLDVSGAMFLDASGVRALVAAHREARRAGRPAPVLRGVRPLLARSLSLAGLREMFEVEPAPPPSGIRRTSPQAPLPPVPLGIAA